MHRGIDFNLLPMDSHNFRIFFYKGHLCLWHWQVKKRPRPGPKIRWFSSQSDNRDIFFIRSNKHLYILPLDFSLVKDNATEPHGSGRGGYWWRPLPFLSINWPQDCSRPSKLRLNAHFYSANTVALLCTRSQQEAFFNSQDETRNNIRQFLDAIASFVVDLLIILLSDFDLAASKLLSLSDLIF